MGFLKDLGKIIEYKDAEEARKQVRDKAIEYILSWDLNYPCNEQTKYITKFGYEVEAHKIYKDDKNKSVLLDTSGIMNVFNHSKNEDESEFVYQPEFAKFMIEVIPNKPFLVSNLHLIEENMLNMRKDFDRYVGKDKYLFLSGFPLLGSDKKYYYLENLENEIFTNNEYREEEENHRNISKYNEITKSKCINDVIINNHPRFISFSRHSRERTGNNPTILVPVFKDKNTLLKNEFNENYIYGDAFGLGMGHGCLQVTAGMENLNCALYVYDQIINILPLITALSASTPFFKGYLTDYDNRFNIISQACDDRTNDEKDSKSDNHVFCSRYSFIYSYLSDNAYVQPHHDDLPKMNINKEYYDKLLNKGISHKLAYFLCCLLVRDPMIIFEKQLEIENSKDSINFLNFLTSNWNALRFKPTSNLDNDHLYKIEVRPSDLQLTPFENASIVTFIILIIDLIKSHDINFIIPLSLSWKNFDESVKRDAINLKYFWRLNSIRESYKNSKNCKHNFLKNENGLPEDYLNAEKDLENNIKQLTLNQIMNGSREEGIVYPGLINILEELAVKRYGENKEQLKIISSHLKFLSLKASGKFIII